MICVTDYSYIVALFVLSPLMLQSGCGNDATGRALKGEAGSSEAVILCRGNPPAPRPCHEVSCNTETGNWETFPSDAGTPCNGVGVCDGNGQCSAPPPQPTPPPTPTPRVMNFVTAEVTDIQVNFETSQPVTFETRNCTPGADPVLHFFKVGAASDGTAERVQVAIDDNGAGGVNARIAVTPESGSIGFLVLRASNDAFGKCDIHRNNIPWQFGRSVGGKTIWVFSTTVNDRIETVAMPHGSQFQRVYLLSGPSITQRIVGGGTGSSVRFITGGTTASFLVHGVGPTRVVVNDELADADGDGLGNLLEAELGTCSSLSGFVGSFDCSKIKTPKDTDGDGLSDGLEVLGRRDLSPHQLLPYWGANPRHKDIFVEVDFLDNGSTPKRLPPEEARIAGKYWQDTLQTLTADEQADHASLLRNPDGLPGVSMHIDSGLPPPTHAPPSDVTLYGSWGGYNVVPAGSDYRTAWVANMHPARRGLFHWVLGTHGGGGQTSGFSSIANIDSGATLAHELGHTTDLTHWGGDGAGVINCKPQYASPMNYAYSHEGVGFSDGRAPGSLNNVAIAEYGNLAGVPTRSRYADLYERVFGYYVDRSTWSVDFDRDGEIAALGVLVRAYANSRPGGECEGVRERRFGFFDGPPTTRSPAIARSASRVMVFMPTDAGLMLRLSWDNYYNCDAAGGGNFDDPCGRFESPISIVGGRILAADAAQVDFNTTHVVAFTFVDAAGALWGGELRVQSNTVVTAIKPTPLFEGIQGEPAMAVEGQGSAFLVFKDASGTLYESRYIAGSGWGAVFPAVRANGPVVVDDAPGIVVGRMPGDTADHLYLHATHTMLGSPTSG